MSIIKGFLIVAGVIGTLVVAGGAGAMTYLFSGKSVEIAMRDLEVGEPSHAGEREALAASCQAVLGSDLGSKATAVCDCIAGDFEHDLSRVERLMVSASFQQDTRRVVAIGVSIAKTGASRDYINGMKAKLEPSIRAAFVHCAQQ